MALRGVHPSLEELRAVAEDPNQLATIVDRYVSSPEFGATVRELHNEALLLRIQRTDYTFAPQGDIGDKSFLEIANSQFEEPLRLIEDIVMTDQPYTRIVTADYTMADRTVATIWGLPHSGADAWERTAYADGRPTAGILSSAALQIRYRSAAANYNRGRANAIARGLLCHDFLEGDVKIDTKVDLSDPKVVANAVARNPSCAACHQTLDPLASYFFPFQQGNVNVAGYQLPAVGYWDPARAQNWFVTNLRPPGYFGQEPQGIDGLGRAIAADPRFARCAVIHFASYLTETKELSPAWVADLQARFVASNYNAKQLAKAIVLSDEFRVASSADPMEAEGLVGYQKARPAQLRRMLQAITGFDWTGVDNDQLGYWKVGPFAYLDDDYLGYRVLAGGIDSYNVTQPSHTMNATSSLVSRLAAFRAASYAVDHLAMPSDEPAVRARLSELKAQIFGELDDDASDEWQLFSAVLAKSGARRAWIVTLNGMLSDLRAVYY